MCWRSVLRHGDLTATSVSKWATTTFLAPVTEFLSEEFTGMWMGQGGPILWPHRLSYFIWGYIRNACWTRVDDPPDMRCRIIDAVASVTKEMLRNA
jgi:hypothetical protein